MQFGSASEVLVFKFLEKRLPFVTALPVQPKTGLANRCKIDPLRLLSTIVVRNNIHALQQRSSTKEPKEDPLQRAATPSTNS